MDVTEWRGADVFNVFKNADGTPNVAKNDLTELFKVLLPRPCIWKFIVLPNCPAPIRYAATCELHRAGMKAESIMNLFRKIGWVNWDEEESGKQVRAITSKAVDTIGRKKMVEMCLCVPENCDACNNCR